MTKIDDNWQKLFDKFKILDVINKNSFFEITSTQINEFKEARLMVKIDHKSNLPELFKKNDLSILPLTRGTYIISNFNTYQDIAYTNIKNTEISPPNYLESIDYNNLYSEPAVLLCAYHAGIIDEILGEETKFTIFGKMSTSSFEFNIQNSRNNNYFPIKVRNSQCEIDGGFESDRKLLLLEVKNQSCNDFLIRQIYYPYRLWSKKIRKEVIPAFLTYSNNVFSFFKYRFIDLYNYNSIELVEQKNFILGAEPISLEDIIDILDKIKIIKDPSVPFPQADSFKRVIDLLGLLMENELSHDDITANFDFNKRQTSYYASAAIYLDLIEKHDLGNDVFYKLRSECKNQMLRTFKEKYLYLAKKILEHEVFNKSLKLYLKKCSPVNKNEVYEIMKQSYVYNVESDSTLLRRAQTVIKWIEWILDLPKLTN